MAENDNDHIVKLSNVRLSFPVLFEAKPFSEGGKKEFSATFLIPKQSPIAEQIKAVFAKMATAKWGEKGIQQLAGLFRDDRLCMHDGDRKEYDGYADHYYLRASNAVRPLVLDRARNPISESDGKIYSGCYVNAQISLWVQDNKWGKRINANLRGVQFFADGEAFAGGTAAKLDEFEAIDSAPAATLDSLGF